jgi:ABC-type nickel/cobalt efflux system permease component RcnA
VATLAIAASLAARPQTAFAHPIGNFTINRYARLEVYRDRLRIVYVIDMAELPTIDILRSIDTNGDGDETEGEVAAFGARAASTYQQALAITANGQSFAPALVASAAQLLVGQAGLYVTRIMAVYDAPFPAAEPGTNETIRFEDRNLLNSQGWKEIVVRGSPGAEISVDTRLTIEHSDALRSYPSETLQANPDVSEASFGWVAGSGSEAQPATLEAAELLGPTPQQVTSETTPAPNVSRPDSGVTGVFSKLLERDRSLGFVVLSLVIACAFGAQHALGPGHGKTMVAAYLVGSNGTPKQAVVLGLTVTATHTSTVYLLGIVTLVAASHFAPETVFFWMSVASGALVVLFGGTLFVGRLMALREAHGPEHRHGLFSRPHTHRPEEHQLVEGKRNAKAGRATWRSVVSLGVLGGLLPCPSAVVVMVAAVSQGEVALGMLLIVAFSVGLATVLTAIGLSLVLGRKVPGRHIRFLHWPPVARVVAVMPVVSALVVMLVGLGITYQALAA